MHPLYPVACRFVRRSVIVHHTSGRTYSGILQAATPSGIYLLPAPVVASGTQDTHKGFAQLAIASEEAIEAHPVYAPAAYFGFGALTGFTLGSLAASRYGYGGYGYGGYGYGYGGYGYPGFFW